jgi:hypothetical protein
LVQPRNRRKCWSVSSSPEWNIARLNFSHGSFEQHAEVIELIRSACKATGRRVAIMGDLPGPKMGLGTISPDPIHLGSGEGFTLTSEDITDSTRRVSMSFESLPQMVKPGDRLFLNDGLVQLDNSRWNRKASCSSVPNSGRSHWLNKLRRSPVRKHDFEAGLMDSSRKRIANGLRFSCKKERSVYDLNAKIIPESDPVYDLTAIDS